MWWDEERIGWYDRAAEGTLFHRSLAGCLEKYISKDERILELGCGLGYVSELMHRDGYSIMATDNDPLAIENAVKRSALKIFSILDADGPIPETDTLLMIFFGRITEGNNLQRYLASAGKIIYVISEHRGQSNELRKRPGEPESTIRFLESRGNVSYRHIPFEADFSQPLEDENDARRYIERMYGNEKSGEYMKFLKCTKNGLLLPNMKHASVFIITKRR